MLEPPGFPFGTGGCGVGVLACEFKGRKGGSAVALAAVGREIRGRAWVK